MKGLEHQQGVLEFGCCLLAQRVVGQQPDQRLYIVATVHIAQQFYGVSAVDKAAVLFATGNRREEAGFDIGGFIHPGRHARGDQVNQEVFLSCRWIF